MPVYAYAVLAAGWLILMAKRSSEPVGQRDRRARWGIVLEGVAYSNVVPEQVLGEPIDASLNPDHELLTCCRLVRHPIYTRALKAYNTRMKISRRALAGMALAGAASAQTAAPQTAAEDLDQAKKLVASNSEALRKYELAMAAEPAFQFKA
jgi:hypothetical protein